jgi:coenzyme F420-0:L-glutamate ligase/coenzyme F420-1:gamma-L-glutamate ligase
MSAALELRALHGIPEVLPGADLAAIIRAALQRADIQLQSGDVLVIAQKIVSKSEGRFLDLRTLQPSARAIALAESTGKDPRFVEAVLGESSEVVRTAPNTLIVRHRSGYVMANAGIDRSNVPGDEHTVLLLPRDCDAAARALRATLPAPESAVIISDSFGRPWREGVVNVALGSAGLAALVDHRGGRDRQGRVLQTTQVAIADALAAAAGLVLGEASEGTPVAHVRGFRYVAIEGSEDRGASTLLRPRASDLFA